MKQWQLAVLALLLAAVVALLVRQPVVEWPIPVERVTPQTGHAYTVRLDRVPLPPLHELRGDTSDEPRRSTLQVLRNGEPLGPPHSVHDAIASKGAGAYSHWHDYLYFSAPANADPRSDGATYAVRGYPQLPAWLRLVLIGAAALLALPLVIAFLRALSFSARFGTALKLAATAAVLALAPWGWIPLFAAEAQRLSLAGRWGFLALFVALAVLGLAAVMIAPFVRDWRIRVPVVLLLLAALAVDQVMLGVSRHPMTLELMETFLRERAMAGTVLPAYGGTIAVVAGIGLLLAAPFVAPPHPPVHLHPVFALVPLVALVGTTFVVHGTRGRTEAFAAPVAVPAQLVSAALLAGAEQKVERPPVEYEAPLQSPFRKIVMVVDESVRGDYLGLNNPKFDNTPFLLAAGPALANFGVATSAANCSVAARLIMRIGLQKPQLPDTREVWRRMPTVWQYAKKAGYTTALVDAWRAVGEFHSYMDADEARSIDMTKSALQGPEWTRDRLAADMVIELLRRDEAMFIYVNKNGAHPDYAQQYPPDLGYDSSRHVAALPLDDKRRRAVADYHRALRWSVDAFFEHLMPHLLREDTVLLYTSDHGQSLYEGGYDLSHCSLGRDLHVGEVLVPMFVITGSPAAQASFAAESKRAFGRASHFEVMPTLLELMGFAPAWVRGTYGPGLSAVPIDRRRGFLLGTFYHPAAVWIDVDPAPRAAAGPVPR